MTADAFNDWMANRAGMAAEQVAAARADDSPSERTPALDRDHDGPVLACRPHRGRPRRLVRDPLRTTRSVDHDAGGVPVAATFDVEFVGGPEDPPWTSQPVECLSCRRKMEKEATP